MPHGELKTFDVLDPDGGVRSILSFRSDERFQKWLERAGWRGLVLLKDAGKRRRTEVGHLDQVISGEIYVSADVNRVRITVRFASAAASFWPLV
jgi:hypothetical protein